MKFGLIENFAFYSSYHSHPVNKAIHIVCIPLITWTIAVFLSYTFIIGLDIHNWKFVDGANINMGILPLNGTLIVAVLYSVYYLCLEPFAGIIMTIILFGFWLSSAWLEENFYYIWIISLGIHILAWVFQFVGHGVFEKRKPALLDSLVQAVLMAPLFVLLEVMFMCGYRPQLQQKILMKKEETRRLILVI